MAFRIKNITPFTVPVLGIDVNPKQTIDLLATLSAAQIRDSILFGELYDKLMGRMLSLSSPMEDYDKVGLSDAEIARLMHAGILQGYSSEDRIKDPFHFNEDGYLLVDTHLSVDLAVDIRGDSADPAARDSVLAMGTEDGTVAGTVHVMQVDPTGVVQVGIAGGAVTVVQPVASQLNAQVVGNIADGVAAAGNPVRVAGQDLGGLVRTILTSNTGIVQVGDGAGSLTVDQGTAANLNAQVVGNAAAGAAVSGNPVQIAGSDGGGLIRRISTDTSGNTQVVGPIAAGSAPTLNPLDLAAVTQLADPAASADGLLRRLRLDDLWCLFTRSKSYDSATGADKSFEVAPVNSTYAQMDYSQSTAVAGGATYNYYIDMAGYGYLSIQYANLAGSYTKTLKIYASNRDDGTAPASLAAGDWYDITTQWFGSATFTAANFLEKDTATVIKWVKVEVVVSAGANVDNTWNLWCRKKAL